MKEMIMQVWFCLQIVAVTVGTAWCIAVISTLCFGGWYVSTHPATGNDQVIRRLVRLLCFLTFGLTELAALRHGERGYKPGDRKGARRACSFTENAKEQLNQP